MMFLLTASRLAELIMQRGDFKKVSRAACWFFYFLRFRLPFTLNLLHHFSFCTLGAQNRLVMDRCMTAKFGQFPKYQRKPGFSNGTFCKSMDIFMIKIARSISQLYPVLVICEIIIVEKWPMAVR